jgi:hypothetical protein
MGFSIKLVPGVGIRVSSRRIRTCVGPWAVRLRVGFGRTGFSSGAGPIGFHTPLSGTRRSSSETTRCSGAGALQRTLASAAKAQHTEHLRLALTNILNGSPFFSASLRPGTSSQGARGHARQAPPASSRRDRSVQANGPSHSRTPRRQGHRHRTPDLQHQRMEPRAGNPTGRTGRPWRKRYIAGSPHDQRCD